MANNFIVKNGLIVAAGGITAAGTIIFSNLTSNGFLKTSASNGTLVVDTSTYLTANQSISLTNDITGTGTTSISATIGANKVTFAKMQAITTGKLLGSGGSGGTAITEVTLGTGLTWSGTTLNASSSGGALMSSVVFKVGDSTYPADEASTYTDSTFIGKTIMVYRAGDLQYQGDTTYGYTFNSSTGLITFYPSLTSGETIEIKSFDAVGTAYVSTVSVATANGFSGSVTNATSTPSITLTTTITGLLKGNGTAISAATAADVTGQLITGYVSGAGVITASDSILTAINKLSGNITALSSSAGITRNVSTPSTTTALGSTANTDYVVFASGTITLTLPTAVGNTNRYTIKNVGSGTISIATTSSQTIDAGTAPITITRTNNSLDFVSDGTNWKIV